MHKERKSGQATTEYVLMLTIAVGFVLLLITQFIKPVVGNLTGKLTQYLNQSLANGNLHHIRIKN